MTSNTDRVEQSIFMKAPRSRVWRALTDSEQFGTWFGATFDGPFVASATVNATFTGKGYEHLTMRITIAAITPERHFSFRWHPYAIDPNVEYSSETPTLVEFTLEEKDGGTFLRVTESGFDKVPLERRAKAFEMNSKGWAIQVDRIAEYVDGR